MYKKGCVMCIKLNVTSQCNSVLAKPMEEEDDNNNNVEDKDKMDDKDNEDGREEEKENFFCKNS